MGRARVGSVFRHGDHFDVQITFPDGRRSPRECLPPKMSEARARDFAMKCTLDAVAVAEGRLVLPGEPELGETFAKWCDRWLADRKARGLKSVHDNRGHLDNWVLPMLGARPITTITKRDLEQLVERLDAAVRAEKLAWKSARNVWATVSKAFDDATNAKSLALRVLEVDPADKIRGPDRGVDRAASYLYPNEFLALVSCERVPLRWRRIYALTAYTYTRAGEMLALDWSDVDFEAGTIHVHKSLNGRSEIVSTKTKETRRVPIEPNLLPLLRAMRAEAKGEGRVVTLPRKKAAAELREHLQRAGVTRADLFADDAHRKALTFHDGGRATGITWMALRGDDPLRIQRRAGHSDFDTTQGYIREAEAFGPDIGKPFPPLPASLISLGISLEREAPIAQVTKMKRQSERGGRDSNPRPPA